MMELFWPTLLGRGGADTIAVCISGVGAAVFGTILRAAAAMSDSNCLSLLRGRTNFLWLRCLGVWHPWVYWALWLVGRL